MIATTAVHAEGPRYGVPIVFLSGLWVGPRMWRPAATYFAHRGWEGTLVDTRGVAGTLDARARAVAELVRTLPAPPVLVGHDAGALVALGAARHAPARALVLAAPLVPGSAGAQAHAWSWRLPWALLRRRPIVPADGTLAQTLLAELPGDWRNDVAAEDPRLLAALARGGRIVPPDPLPPTLVVRGERDPLLPPAEGRAFARALGAEDHEIPSGGHWFVAVGQWQRCVHVVHRWLVQRLGAPLLELYAEAMADRDADDAEE